MKYLGIQCVKIYCNYNKVFKFFVWLLDEITMVYGHLSMSKLDQKAFKEEIIHNYFQMQLDSQQMSRAHQQHPLST